jgi:serine-type D-Ala-D-Ala carboxypeptidase
MEPPKVQQHSQSDESALQQVHGAALDVLLTAVRGGVFPGASVVIGYRRQRVRVQAGRLTYDQHSQAVAPETLFDCASLTKVVATATMAAILLDRDALNLDTQLADFSPEFLHADDPLANSRRDVTIRHLLAHTSGLPAYAKFYLQARRPDDVLTQAMHLPLACKPGAQRVYSDVGFILLGAALEQAAQGIGVHKHSLDTFCAREIFQPLRMVNTLFNPPRELSDSIAPTEWDDAFRRRLVQGEVHDENAWIMGGVAPHAGLFSTADDLAVFCQFMLDAGNWKGRQLIKRETIAEFTRTHAAFAGAPRALGWDKPSPSSSSGKYFSPASYGHLGFTGTSVWVDPEKQLYVVLLTNRIHPTRANEAIRKFRPAFHDVVVEALGANT